jgi:hypothetical protein
MENNNFIPLITLGLLKNPDGTDDDDTAYPAAQSYNLIDEIKLSPEAIAGFMVSAFECFINTVPESQQIEFEKKALRIFSKKVKTREQIMESFDHEED